MTQSTQPITPTLGLRTGLALLFAAIIVLFLNGQPAHAQSGNCTPTPTLLRNQASVVANQSDADPSNNSGAVCVGLVTPISFILRKELTTPDPLRVGEDVTFTLRITNTGSSAIDVLPLRDLYDTNKLLYLGASVLPDDSTNDGQLDWSDLTISLGQNLLPNQSFAVQVSFFARSDTTHLPGGATINTALSPISPTYSVTAPVRIEAPTGVNLASHSARHDLGQGVLLDWETANEAEIVGFNLLRRELGGGGWVRLNAELIEAQQPGQATGASYSFTDANVQFGRSYLYVVEMVDAGGNVIRREMGVVLAGSRVLLPVVLR